MKTKKRPELTSRRDAPLVTPTDLTAAATKDIAGAMNAILADVFALYLKTKNFHWHMSGPHFRDYHLLLDEQADQLFAMTDPIAERVRKIGGTHVGRSATSRALQRVLDNDADYVEPSDMLAELCEDNKALAARLREAHNVCEEHRDIATASLIEVWIDETERRTWFLFESQPPGRLVRALMGATTRDIFGRPEDAEPATPGSYGEAPRGFRLPTETRLGRVRLQVAGSEASLAFYQGVLGFRTVQQEPSRAVLAAQKDDASLSRAARAPGARPAPRQGALGLYHFAILLPDRTVTRPDRPAAGRARRSGGTGRSPRE